MTDTPSTDTIPDTDTNPSTDWSHPDGSTAAVDSTVDRYLASIEAGAVIDGAILDPAIVFDATVPNWRMTRTGIDATIGVLHDFYHHPGRFEQVRRIGSPTGEVVELTLTWVEDGVPHAVHQSHIIELGRDGRIVRDTMFCGGRWSADLLAEMEAADAV